MSAGRFTEVWIYCDGCDNDTLNEIWDSSRKPFKVIRKGFTWEGTIPALRRHIRALGWTRSSQQDLCPMCSRKEQP